MKCLREKGQGPRIDQYFLRSQSSQSNEIQRQEANHSSQDISTPVIDVRRTCMDTVSDEPNDPCEPGQTNQHKREKNLNGHKPGVKWPRACEKTAWNTVNTDLCFALERLSGTVEKKLDKFGDIIYAYGSERFGVEKRKEKVQTIPGKSRRQQEIERLVRERRQLRKQWRRAEQSQKEGLNLLQRVIKDKLATLRRAERLRKRYKKKERARANFYKDPFKFVKKLFTSEKNGTLKASKRQAGGRDDESFRRSGRDHWGGRGRCPKSLCRAPQTDHNPGMADRGVIILKVGVQHCWGSAAMLSVRSALQRNRGTRGIAKEHEPHQDNTKPDQAGRQVLMQRPGQCVLF
ncbi:UNVERIFIED_CONTAM: hypothetical protein FKN15_034648 [Acipenser sinensis]